LKSNKPIIALIELTQESSLEWLEWNAYVGLAIMHRTR